MVHVEIMLLRYIHLVLGESTNTNEFGYEVTVSNGRFLRVGNGNSALGNNQFVLSAHGAGPASLKSLKVGTPVVLQPRQELEGSRNCWWRYG